ncbi:DHS-like NAD/FAD-binding domain-containing protein [Lobosporangium transversale]|uniref:DHS-like NAD/FAD-binding domain-containing protein n=1 Tax=Lobosporangium transversale TaxID=64571 RepID=A0A1Y2GLQ5_9FUNG|nr:DHS-like NAD/FAD-binding domain-containing protein [Lobosporangium transversale]ORZ14946.1 DHS-like NAD/FAD-binding domain-containing protein [Lobosporangium transversale]|eukprot:XP_021881078.1 DHS-like NAD/FAD-binding domain-containing protein [Lobosporangium transversale]
MRVRISSRSVATSIRSSVSSNVNKAFSPVAVQELTSFFRDHGPNITVLTGAGVSTDSAIPDYRGENGTYTLNPDYKPIFYQAFVASNEARHRYWARSFFGFPPIMTTQPNPTHFALTALQQPTRGYIRTLITQNVDGLHQKAGTTDVVELHGSLHRVQCMSCEHEQDRSEFQKILADMNPEWDALLQSQTSSSLYSRMNADGDVELLTPEQQQQQQQQQHQQTRNKLLDYRSFRYPTCSHCGSGHYKPNVVFFGENVPVRVKEHTYQAILESDGLLIIGSSLATYSAFRLVKLAKDTGLPIAIINLGPSRGDPLASLRYDVPSTPLLRAVADQLGLGPIPGEIKHRKRSLNVVGS